MQREDSSKTGYCNSTSFNSGEYAYKRRSKAQRVNDSRLRAVIRGGPEVREAFCAGKISLPLAAKLGPNKPDAKTAKVIEGIKAELGSLPNRAAVERMVRERLGVFEKSTTVRLDFDANKAALQLVDAMGEGWCLELMLSRMFRRMVSR